MDRHGPSFIESQRIPQARQKTLYPNWYPFSHYNSDYHRGSSCIRPIASTQLPPFVAGPLPAVRLSALGSLLATLFGRHHEKPERPRLALL